MDAAIGTISVERTYRIPVPPDHAEMWTGDRELYLDALRDLAGRDAGVSISAVFESIQTRFGAIREDVAGGEELSALRALLDEVGNHDARVREHLDPRANRQVRALWQTKRRAAERERTAHKHEVVRGKAPMVALADSSSDPATTARPETSFDTRQAGPAHD